MGSDAVSARVSMPTVTLPGGVRMPLVGFGTHPMRGPEAAAAVAEAIGVGYRSVDTATRYRNEDAVGEGWRASGIDRDELFLTTKLPADGVGREDEILQESLRLLGTDFLDLWLIHWPPGGRAGVRAWERLRAARDRGRVRAIGVSNYSLPLLDALKEATGEYPAVNQVAWSPVLWDERLHLGCVERGIVLGAHSPFRSARLEDPVLARVAARHGVSARQVIVRWNVQHGVAVVPKSSERVRMAANLAIPFELSAAEMAELDGLSER